jgi:hypothetical protein
MLYNKHNFRSFASLRETFPNTSLRSLKTRFDPKILCLFAPLPLCVKPFQIQSLRFLKPASIQKSFASLPTLPLCVKP